MIAGQHGPGKKEGITRQNAKVIYFTKSRYNRDIQRY
jgi:hypothetical protein